jgi:hypothetical protein
MCSVVCKNYCQFHLSLYGSSNSMLFVLNSLEMHVMCVCVCVCVCFCSGVVGHVDGWALYKLVSNLVVEDKLLGSAARQGCRVMVKYATSSYI